MLVQTASSSVIAIFVLALTVTTNSSHDGSGFPRVFVITSTVWPDDKVVLGGHQYH